MDYNHRKSEEKWSKRWASEGVYETDLKKANKKFYNLMMFPYPSAEGLHVGNMYAFTGADFYGRYKAMQGFEVFEPIGLDGFGIHSENYAIKIGKHPVDQAKISEKRFYEQLSKIGNRFAWDERLETYDPEYYKWTQWLFIKMFEAGLAYRKKSMVNWCPSCKTVLADEQVENGECERCKNETTKKETEQWFFKITEYADRLLNNIEKIDWPKKIKIAQKNWIGRSEGVEVDWEVKGLGKKITTFTTRLDTIYGVTFLVLAPEHELAESLSKDKKAVEYIKKALLKSEQQRKTEEKDKTGVDTGRVVVHPLTGEEIPVYVADFVLKGYGTGAVMGVPAYDKRDKEFASKFKLPVVSTLKDQDEVYKELDKKKLVRKKVNFHLRDWIISRQRYWGPPIPMLECPKCGWVAEKQENLPVKLPKIDDYKPTGDGKSPLEKAGDEWLYAKCTKCGGKAKRETDVSDTFLDSSWYFLRYPSIGEKEVPFSKEMTKKWLPVDAYIGGAEHAVLHLLYARFVTMALKDWGYVSFEEPFPFLYSHGLIIKDGKKMSKSRGNVVNPDKYIEKYGADTLRTYLMFIGPYNQGGDFRDTGMRGMSKFLGRVWRLVESEGKAKNEKGLRRLQHKTVKRVTEAMESFKYNVGIAALMEYVNGMGEVGADKEAKKALVLMLAPMAPYMTEEMWKNLEGKFSVHQQSWPKFDEELAKGEKVTVVVQVNGRLRARLELGGDEALDKEKVLGLAKKEDRVKEYVEGKKMIREVFVPGRLVNLVVK